MKASIREYNNKTMKGKYVVISEKGKPHRKYKYKEGETNISDLQDYYKERWIEGKKVSLKERRIKLSAIHKRTYSSKRKRKVESRGRKIEDVLERGIGRAIIHNAETAGNTEIKRARKQVLNKIVRDVDILEIMVEDENFNKLRDRTEYNLILKRGNGQKMGEAFIHGKEMRNVLETIKDIIKVNYERRKNILRDRGYTQTACVYNETSESVDLEIKLRKG